MQGVTPAELHGHMARASRSVGLLRDGCLQLCPLGDLARQPIDVCVVCGP